MSITRKREKIKQNKLKAASLTQDAMLEERSIVGYVRVSTDKQFKEGYSFESQKEAIKDYCLGNNLVLDKVYEDVFSGSSSNRKGFNRLKEDIMANQIKMVIAIKIDRLSRDTFNFLSFKKLCEKHSVIIKTIDTNIDYSTDEGELISLISAQIGKMERKKITERTNQGRIDKWKSGEKAQGTILGYVHDKNSKRNIIVKEEAELVYFIFCRYLSVRSLKQLSDELNSEGYKTKRGKPFTKQSLHLILNNRFYIGTVKYNGITTQGMHKPIISRELFGRVQAKLEKSRRRD